MQQYLECLDTVLTCGLEQGNRTATRATKTFGESMVFDIGHGFPLLTTKKVAIKAIIHELLWFLSGSTNVKYLQDNGVSIWDEWATEEQCAKFGRPAGELGPVYGHQWRNFGATKNADGSYNKDGVDQISDLINEIKTNPDSRRLIVTGWNPKEIKEVALPPCHTLFQFSTQIISFRARLDLLAKKLLIESNISMVTDIDQLTSVKTEKLNKLMEIYKIPERYLDCQLYQRSGDMFLGVPFNIASYSLLTMMVAQVTNCVARQFTHILGDAHIYHDHVDQVNTQLSRTPIVRPTMILNPTIENIFDFKYEDFNLIGYNPHPAIPAPVAV